MQMENCPYLPGLRGRGAKAGCSETVGLNDFCRLELDKDELPEANCTSHTAAQITLISSDSVNN